MVVTTGRSLTKHVQPHMRIALLRIALLRIALLRIVINVAVWIDRAYFMATQDRRPTRALAAAKRRLGDGRGAAVSSASAFSFPRPCTGVSIPDESAASELTQHVVHIRPHIDVMA